MVFKSSSKKKLSIAIVVVFALMILSGIGIGVFFFVKDKGDGGLTKNQIAFGTAISRFDNKPSFSSRNFAGVYDGSLSNVLDYSDEFLAYESDGDTFFVSFDQKQPFVLDFNFDELVSIYGKVARVKKNQVSYLIDLENKTNIASFADCSVSFSFNFIFVKAPAGETFEYYSDNKTENVSSLILNTSSNEVVYKTNLSGDEIDIQFGKYFASVYTVSKTTVYSLSNNFKKVLELDNLGQETNDEYNLKSTLSSKAFVMIEYYKASELSSRALLLEKVKAVTAQDEYVIKQVFSGYEVFYNIEYNIYDAKTEAYAFIASNGCLLSAGTCEFSDAYVAVLRNKVIDKTSISNSTDIEYYYLQTNKVSKGEFSLEKLVLYDFDKYGKIVGYEKGKLLTAGGTESGIIDFAGNSTNCILTNAGEKAESTALKNSVIVYSSISGMKGVKLSDGTVLFDAVYDKISTVVGKNMIAKRGNKYYVLNTDKNVSEINNFATEFEDYVFSDIGFYFTKNAGKYNVYNLDKTAYKLATTVRFVESRDVLNLYIGSSELLQFTLPNGIKNKNIEIDRVGTKFVLSSKSFTGSVRDAIATVSDTLTPKSIDVDKTTGAGYVTFEKNYAKTELSKLDFVSYDSLSSEQKQIVPVFDNVVKQAYTWTGATAESTVNYICDGVHIEANTYAIIAIIRLKEEGTSTYSYMVNFAMNNAYLVSANLSTTRESVAGSTQMVYFDALSKYQTAIANKTSAPAVKFRNAYVGLFGDESAKENRIVNYNSFGFDGGIVFSSTTAETLSYKFVISNVYVSEIKETSNYSLNAGNGEVWDNGTYTITFIKTATEKKIKVQAKEGFAFKNATFVYTVYDAVTGKYNESTVPVATLSEYATGFTVDYSEISSDYYFKIKNISIIEWYSRLIMKDYEGSEAEDKIAYYFYGYSQDVVSKRNPAPFGFVNFARKYTTPVFARAGYTFEGFEKDTNEAEKVLIIDKNGSFVGDAEIMFVKADTIVEHVLTAKYTANKYQLYYKNGGTTLPAGKEVTFDQPVGTLLTKEEIEIPTGYIFKGWYYENNLFTEETIYTFPNDILIEAKYEPKTYTLKFDANLDSYFGVSIKGFDYNINKVFFETDFEGYYGDDEFTGEITKTITFGQQFGALPTLKAYRNESGTNQETYIFVGWFDTKEFTVEGETVSYGTQYTEANVVETDPPIETLYAHYTKKIYRVDIEDKGEDVVSNDAGLVPHFDKITYVGSNKNGTQKQFSTKNEDGFENLSKNANGLYNLYTVEDASLLISVQVNDGYFISKIVVNIYNGTAIQTYTVTGEMRNGQFVLSGSVTGATLSKDGTNVSINFAKLLTNKIDNGENLSATIAFETGVLRFSNAFTISGTNLKVEKTGGGFTATGDKTDSGIIYNIKSEYKFIVNSLNGASGTFDLAVLKKFVFNSTTINFGFEYEKDNDTYYNVLKPSIAPNTSIKNGNIIVSTFDLGDGTFTIKYNTVSKQYEYTLSVVQYTDNTVSFETVDVKSSVSLSHENISDASAVGMSVAYETNISGKTDSGNYGARETSKTFSSVLPTDKITYKVTLKNDSYIMAQRALVMNYGGTNYSIMLFSNEIDTSEQKIVQTHTIAANEQFKADSGLNIVEMNGTSVSVAYDKNARTFTIVVGGIYKNISFTFKYSEYRYVSINGDESTYETKIVGGTHNGKTLNEISSSDPTNVSADVQKRIVEKTVHYIIFLTKDTNIQKIEITTTNTSVDLYRISTSSAGGNYVLSDGNTKATITLSDDKYFCAIYIDRVARQITLTNHLGNGGSSYRIDNTPLITMMLAYYGEDGGLATHTYVSDSGGNGYNTIAFYGKQLIITFSPIQNYNFEKVVLKNLSTDTEISYSTITIDPTTKAWRLVYNLESTEFDSKFGFDSYFKPYTFKIKYDFAGITFSNDLSRKTNASSSMDSELLAELNKTYNVAEGITAYWDVPYTIINESKKLGGNKSRVGYSFRGYSLSNGDTYSVDYASGAIVTNFKVSAGDMTDGKVINLYAVYTAKKYTIGYLTGSNNESYKYGSSPVSTTSGATTVNIDDAFGELRVAYRVGYRFLGWFTKPMGDASGVEVTSGTVLTRALYEELRNDRAQMAIYAHWEAIEFTINFDKNDSGSSNGSTSVIEGKASITIMFDDENALIESFNDIYNRIGYTLLGFNSRQVKAGASLSYENFPSGVALTYALINESKYGVLVSSKVGEPINNFTLYAVWQAKVYKMYINTREGTLLGHGKSNGAKVEKGVEFRVQNYQGTDASGAYYTNVTFDKSVPYVPLITATGYTYNGIFTSTSGGTKVTGSTVLNASLASTVGITLTSESFNTYAQYTRQERKITVRGNGNLSSSSPTEASGGANVYFFVSGNASIWTKRGYYISTIRLIGSKETIKLTYGWDSEKQTMVHTGTSSSIDSTVTADSDNTTLYHSMKVLYSYSRDASGDADKQSCGLYFYFSNIKDNIRISVESASVQTYSISFYAYRNGSLVSSSPYAVHNFDLSGDGVTLYQNWIRNTYDYPYVAGYKFVEYRYAVKDGDNWVLDTSDNGVIPLTYDATHVVAENRRVYAVYAPSNVQGVHFYFYNVETGTYEQRSSDSEYMLYNGGSVSGSNLKYDRSSYPSVSGGKLLNLPSVGSFLWPSDTVLCGFVIASSAPASGYYNKSNSSALKEFDCSTKVEEELNVYAVYDEQYFNLTRSGSTLRAEYSLYQEYDGTYIQVTSSIVFYRLTTYYYNRYLENINSGMTAENALYSVVNKNLITPIQTTVNKTSVSASISISGSGYYYFAVIRGTNGFYKISNSVST